MKKLLLIAVLFGASFAKAQVSYGLKAGVTLGEISNSLYKQQTHPSVFFSAYADIPFATNFSIQSGVTIGGKGSDFTESYDFASLDHVLSVMTIEVPVNAVYSIPTGNTGKFMLGVGPYIGFNVSGKDNYVGHIGSTKVEVSDDLTFTGKDRSLNLLDVGGNFMVGYRFNHKLVLRVNYNLGLTDINPRIDKTQSFRNWAFGVGFQF